MNTVVTSREQLLAAAKEIAAQDGIAAVNIRAVAARCGISIGSIYNYFSTKAELVVTVIEDFWLSAAEDMRMAGNRGDFLSCFEAVFRRLQNYLSDFEENWLEQISLLSAKERQMGRRREVDYFGSLRAMFIRALKQDGGIPQSVWASDFTPEQMAEFALENLISILKRGEECGYFLLILKRLLHPNEM